MDTATVSVIVSGLVALSSLLVPIIVDYCRSKREKKGAATANINNATLELLRELSYFRHWIWGDIETSACRPIQQVFSDLQVKHYAWERAIWAHLADEKRIQVRGLREQFQAFHTQSDISKGPGESRLPALANEILELTYTATRKFD